MKIYSIPTLALLAAILTTSCSDGSLIESNIGPETLVGQRDAQSEKEIVFTTWQELVIAPPECPMFIDALARELSGGAVCRTN